MLTNGVLSIPARILHQTPAENSFERIRFEFSYSETAMSIEQRIGRAHHVLAPLVYNAVQEHGPEPTIAEDVSDEVLGVAYHEAGHAVIATALGMEVSLVTIVREHGRRGRCEHQDVFAVAELVLVKLAGLLTHARGLNDPYVPFDRADGDLDFATRWFLPDRLLSLAIATNHGLTTYWREARTVAKVLLSLKTIDGKRLKNIVRIPTSQRLNQEANGPGRYQILHATDIL
jgi:hypothetical protein